MADEETREEMVERLREENAKIMIENDVYEAYLQRVVKEPKVRGRNVNCYRASGQKWDGPGALHPSHIFVFGRSRSF